VSALSDRSDRSDRYEFGAVRFENIDVSSVNWEEAIEKRRNISLDIAGQ